MILDFQKFYEAKNIGDVYHFTNIPSLVKMVKSDTIAPSKSTEPLDRRSKRYLNYDGDELPESEDPDSYYYYISTTRENDFWKRNPEISGTMIRIKLDGSKISQNYKITPFSFFTSNISKSKIGYVNESEERIVLKSNKGIQLSKYLKKIDLIWEPLLEIYKRKPITIQRNLELLFNSNINFNIIKSGKALSELDLSKTIELLDKESE
jgi:hypothetical protein